LPQKKIAFFISLLTVDVKSDSRLRHKAGHGPDHVEEGFFEGHASGTGVLGSCCEPESPLRVEDRYALDWLIVNATLS
jgi:hypothetical protein